MSKLKSWLCEEPPFGTGYWCSLARALFGGMLLLKLTGAFTPDRIIADPAFILSLAVSYALALCLLVGFCSRPAVFTWSLICLASFNIQQFQLHNHLRLPLVGPGTYGFPTNLYFIGIILFFLGFTPCEDYFYLFGRSKIAPRKVRLWAVQLIRYQVFALYLWSAISKISSAAFRSGHTLELAWIYSVVGSLGYFHETDGAHIWQWLAAAVILLELLLAVLLFVPRLRKAGILLGIVFHSCAILLFPVKNFTAAIIITYLFFLDPPKHGGQV